MSNQSSNQHKRNVPKLGQQHTAPAHAGFTAPKSRPLTTVALILFLGVVIGALLAKYELNHTTQSRDYYPPEFTFGDCPDPTMTGCGFGA
jgi:hypothetical protein